MNNSFSFDEYERILMRYKESNIDFNEVGTQDSFSLLRHDVEFSVERALEIAKLDSKHKIKSSFLFQVNSDSYNIGSHVNKRIIKKISQLGGNIGLHLYVSHLDENDWESFHHELEYQSSIFMELLEMNIDRFSVHRPPKWILENRNDYIGGIINMYGESFFEYSDSPVNIKYIADSRHNFNYGHPLDNFEYSKFQLLLHPDEWSKDGLNAESNFALLFKENSEKFEQNLLNESSHFIKYKDKLSKKF